VRHHLVVTLIAAWWATNLLADLGPEGLFGGADNLLGTLWDESFAAATAVVPVEGTASLDIEARFRIPRVQVELKQVGLDDISSLRVLGHGNIPLKILMVCTPATRDEVFGMVQVVKQLNGDGSVPTDERLKLHLIVSHAEALQGLPITREDFDATCEICPWFETDDIWMQDWGELAAAHVKGAAKERMVVIDTRRGRGLDELPAIVARQWNGAYVVPDTEEGPPGNYGGNIEVTPDDMLVIGDTSTPKPRDFFARVGYRDHRVCVLETGWLVVGHVDEYLTTLCTPNSEVGFVIVKTDPLLAMDLLKRIEPAALPARLGAMVRSFYAYHAVNGEGIESSHILGLFKTVAHLYEHLHGVSHEWTEEAEVAPLAEFNEHCAAIINRNVDTLVAAIKARHGDIAVDVVSFPGLFRNVGSKALALVPGAVNGVVLRNHMVVPDPLLSDYRDHIATTLSAAGYEAHFLPNGSYHAGRGQWHCGTNVFRHPNRYVHPRYATVKRSATFRRLYGE